MKAVLRQEPGLLNQLTCLEVLQLNTCFLAHHILCQISQAQIKAAFLPGIAHNEPSLSLQGWEIGSKAIALLKGQKTSTFKKKRVRDKTTN